MKKNAHIQYDKLNTIDQKIIDLIIQRGKIMKDVKKNNINILDFLYNDNIFSNINEKNLIYYNLDTIKRVFTPLFLKEIAPIKKNPKPSLLVSRETKKENTIIEINNVKIGNGQPQIIAGPCSIENLEQLRTVAKELNKKNLNFIRGGAFKPRSSPYSFQGLGIEGLKMLKKVGDEFNLITVSEIVTPTDLNIANKYIDIIQIGARNMQNFELLKAAGKLNKPILLKRGLSATIEEFINAAEYIASNGNKQIILCERGIRTYETATRNTLDISAVPILKKITHLPVMVDVTHSTGRKDLLIPTTKAAIAIGADAIMSEVHPNPRLALSDNLQQMDLKEFHNYLDNIRITNK